MPATITAFYQSCLGQQVEIALMSTSADDSMPLWTGGSRLYGTLVDVNTGSVLIRTSSNRELLIFNHAIQYISAVPTAELESSTNEVIELVPRLDDE